MTERSAGETLWVPGALSLLVAVAQLRLELDLALRKLRSGARPATPAPVSEDSVESADPVGVDSPATDGPAPTSETVQIMSPDPDTEPSTATEIDEVRETAEEDSEVAAARRFAKLVATDIRLYNEDAVMLGRREKDLADRLGDQLGRGKTTFLKRHGAMGSAAVEILHAAFVEVLAGGDEELLPVSVLD